MEEETSEIEAAMKAPIQADKKKELHEKKEQEQEDSKTSWAEQSHTRDFLWYFIWIGLVPKTQVLDPQFVLEKFHF